MVDLTKLTKLEALKQLAERVRDGYVSNKDFKVVEGKVTKLEDDVSGLQSTVEGLESYLGDENVLEGVQVNGVDLNPDGEKKVNVTITQSETNGSINVNGTPVPVHGLADMAYKESVAETDLESDLQTKINGKANSTDLTTLQGKVETLVDEDEGKSVRDITVEELAKQLLDVNAEGALAALQNLAEWIKDHPGEADEMNKAIKALEKLVGDIPEEADSENVVNYITEVVKTAIAALNMGQYAKSADVAQEIEDALDGYLKEENLAGYVTETQLNNMIATDTEVTEMLNSVFGTADIE